jgi:hypothetical protein
MAMGGRKWTDEEIAWIDENRSRKTPAQMAKRLKRSRAAVWSIMSKYGMKSYASDTDMLTLYHIYEITGVAAETIKRKWIPNGLQVRKLGTYQMVSQDDLLAYMRDHPEDWDASRLKNVTIFADAEWFDQYRDPPEKPAYHWTAQDVETLKRMYTKGCDLHEISRVTGRTYYAVKRKLCQLREKGWMI